MKKEEIYVEINSEEKRLKAIQILENAGETILPTSHIFKTYNMFIYLEFFKVEWIIDNELDLEAGKTKITLSQLENLLNPIDKMMDNFKKSCVEKGYNVYVEIESEVLKDDDFVKGIHQGKIFFGQYKNFITRDEAVIESFELDKIYNYTRIYSDKGMKIMGW